MFNFFKKPKINQEQINKMVLELINEKNLNSNDIADVIAEQISIAKNSDIKNVSLLAKKLELKFDSKYQKEDDFNYNKKADDFGGYFVGLIMKIKSLNNNNNEEAIISCLNALEYAFNLKYKEELNQNNEKQKTTEFTTITYLNRLINAGAKREFVHAVCAIWFLQAGNDPNTPESKKIVGSILGILENFFVEEAAAIDIDVFNLFTSTIKNNKYGALFEETQPIYTVGRNEVNEKFSLGSVQVMEIYTYYANIMMRTSKQNKNNLLKNLQILAEYIDIMCGLANEAEKNLF